MTDSNQAILNQIADTVRELSAKHTYSFTETQGKEEEMFKEYVKSTIEKELGPEYEVRVSTSRDLIDDRILHCNADVYKVVKIGTIDIYPDRRNS